MRELRSTNRSRCQAVPINMKLLPLHTTLIAVPDQQAPTAISWNGNSKAFTMFHGGTTLRQFSTPDIEIPLIA